MAFERVKKEKPSTEIDLVAFISLLSVCICFLLLTTIWVQIGSMNVKQAIGGQAATGGKANPELWVVYDGNGSLGFNLRNVKAGLARQFSQVKIDSVEGRPNLEKLGEFIIQLKEKTSVEMALIKPNKVTLFEDVISVMDVFRDRGFNDLGVAPL